MNLHLGDPCIHCGIAHDQVSAEECPSATGLSAIVREVHYLRCQLAEHEKTSAATSIGLKANISNRQTALARAEAGLDLKQIALAETIVYATDYSRGGEDRAGARNDAIKWLATGQNLRGGYGNLRREYFGTKSYDRWHGQRTDCEYGMGPSHGSIIFQIGLKREARERELTPMEREAAVYYLINLEAIQKSAAEAKVS